MTYDIVTLGETMLRMTPPGQRRIEQAASFDLEVGGSESNLSVGLVRLGLRVAWLSRLPASPLGRLIANTLRGYGVDTQHVAWSDEDRLGLYFLEEGEAPRGTSVIYDRRDSAMSRMTPADLPAPLFAPGQADQLHLSGITLALSDGAAATAHAALTRAKDAGWRISFDVNYRAKLWSPQAARAGCAPFVAAADILLLPRRDAELIYDLPAELPAEDAVRFMRAIAPQADIVMTLGSTGVIGLARGAETPIFQPALPAAGPGRIGGGDAFAAGFFAGYREDAATRLATGLRWGAAAAAVKFTIPGDIPVFTRDEVLALVASDSDLQGGVRR